MKVWDTATGVHAAVRGRLEASAGQLGGGGGPMSVSPTARVFHNQPEYAQMTSKPSQRNAKGREWHARCSADPVCKARRLQQERARYARNMTRPIEERRKIFHTRQYATYRRRMGVVRKLRAASRCVVCGGFCEQFHHIDPATKSFPLAKGGLHSYQKIAAEAAKCTCLCGQHHRDVHAGRLRLDNPPRLVVTQDMVPASAPAAFRASLPSRAPAPRPAVSIVFMAVDAQASTERESNDRPE